MRYLDEVKRLNLPKDKFAIFGSGPIAIRGLREARDIDLIVKKDEILMLNVNSAATVGFVTELHKNRFKCRLKLPVCADVGARVTISRRVANRFRLIGYGMIKE